MSSLKSFIIFFWHCSPLISDALEMGFFLVSWESFRGWLFHSFSRKWTMSGVMTCLGLYAMLTRTSSVTGEDWPPPQVAQRSHGLVSLVQYSHCIFHRLHYRQGTFCLVPAHSLSVLSLCCPRHQDHSSYLDLPGKCMGIWHVPQASRNHQQSMTHVLQGLLEGG